MHKYSDVICSFAISRIADQQEDVAGLGIVPFFTSVGAGDIGSYRDSILPQTEVAGTTRPTLSYTPLDDDEFTRRLFSPIPLEGAVGQTELSHQAAADAMPMRDAFAVLFFVSVGMLFDPRVIVDRPTLLLAML